MNKPRLIKRNEIEKKPQAHIKTKEVSVANTVTVVKDWLNTKRANTKQNARDAFAQLFSNQQEPCTGC